jgi:hypothetical protein
MHALQAEAEGMLAETYEVQRRVLGDDHPHTRHAVKNLEGVRNAIRAQFCA